jgi:hypothetical protein
MPWDGDLCHLEGDVTAVANDLRADLDQLLFQACQRPVFPVRRASDFTLEIAEKTLEIVASSGECGFKLPRAA